MLFLTEDDVRALLPMGEAVRAVRETFEALTQEDAANQPRRRLAVPTGAVLHSLAGWWKGYFGTKVYATHPKHPPHFLVWLCDANTAAPLALFEANHLGQIRTGAASGYATDLMAPEEARSMAIIGSGFQAWTQVEAVLAVRPLESVRVYSRSADKRKDFAERASRAFGIPVTAAESAEQAVRDAGIVTTATFAKDPVLDATWLKRGVHINAVGSNQPNRRELPADLVRSARWLVVDSVEQARIEAGDLLLASDWEDLTVTELKDWRPGQRRPEDTTIFKSIGLGVEDVAVAALVYEKAKAAGRGRTL